jgi:hypothetical protein
LGKEEAPEPTKEIMETSFAETKKDRKLKDENGHLQFPSPLAPLPFPVLFASLRASLAKSLPRFSFDYFSGRGESSSVMFFSSFQAMAIYLCFGGGDRPKRLAKNRSNEKEKRISPRGPLVSQVYSLFFTSFLVSSARSNFSRKGETIRTEGKYWRGKTKSVDSKAEER